jgi:aryl-phospho-beta-D-glucosidase BglC (GH1 family)
MKRSLSVAVLILAGVVLAAPGAARAALGSGDFLKASGTSLRNGSGAGAVVALRGTNLGGWLLQENWMSPLLPNSGEGYDEWRLRETLTSRFGEATKESLINGYQATWIQAGDLDNIQRMGMNVVRVPILYLDLMDKYGAWKADPWSRLDWLVRECGARGIYVILDLHGTYGAQNTFDNSGETNSAPQLWVNTTYQDRTVTLWQGMAAHFKGNPAVAGYDLLNEPDRVAASQLNAFYNRLYQAIRAQDPDHLVIMEAAWDWNQLVPPSTYGWTNVAYELHYYAMATGQATDWNAQNGLIDGALQGIRDHLSWNVPIYAGEFCVFDFGDLWGKLLGGFNALGVSWTNWTYKVTGGGNWGFYTSSWGTRPDPRTDSAATIAADWATFDTAGHFGANTTFQGYVTPYTRAAAVRWSSLKAGANGSYVSAESAGAGFLVANRAAVGTWEEFQVVNNSDGTVSFLSAISGQYVSADLNQGAKLIANRATIGGWEKFRLVAQSNGTVALQAVANGLYVSADLNVGGVLVANRSVAQGWEQFTITSL